MSKRKPIKCRKCGVTLLTMSEKVHGEHWSMDRCADALARFIKRRLALAELYSKKLQHALKLLDEVQAEVEKIVQIMQESEVIDA